MVLDRFEFTVKIPRTKYKKLTATKMTRRRKAPGLVSLVPYYYIELAHFESPGGQAHHSGVKETAT